MNTQILYYWAQFQQLGNAQKRELFTKLISERLQINCEAHIYRILTRFTFQSMRKKYGETYKFTPIEEQFEVLMKELSLCPSTIHNWYYATIQKHPLQLVKDECARLATGSICECCISDGIKERLKKDYDLRLASKRLYQTIVKAERFKEELGKEKVFLDDAELCKSLRRLVEDEYYKDQYKRRTKFHLRNVDFVIRGILQEQEIKPITVLKWFYFLRHHPELLKDVYAGKMQPDDLFVQTSVKMMKDLRGGIYAANCDVFD